MMPERAQAFLRILNCMTLVGPTGATVINAVKAIRNDWQKQMRITVDSGAAESVIPIAEVSCYPEVKAAIAEWFQTASGETIENEGEQRLPMVTPSGQLRGMAFQACDVTKHLAIIKCRYGSHLLVCFWVSSGDHSVLAAPWCKTLTIDDQKAGR